MVTIEDAAAHVLRSPSTLRTWVERGLLVPVNPGRRPLRFVLADVIEADYALRPKRAAAWLDEVASEVFLTASAIV